MSSTALKIAAVVTVIIAIVLALVAFQMTRSYTRAPAEVATPESEGPAESEEDRMQRAVVALQALQANQPIAAEQVRVAPVAARPEGHFTSIDDVVNRIPLVPIDPGQPLSGRHFKESNELARIVPEGHKAVSVEVDDVIAVGGFLRPGDIVDIILYLRGGSEVEAVQARRLLSEVGVLALEDRIIDRPADQPDDDRRRRQRTVVLAIPDDQVTRFMLGATLGQIRFAMHGQPSEALALDALSDDELRAAAREADPQLIASAEAAAEPPKPGTREADQPITAGQLSGNVQRQPEGRPRHRIYVYRGSAIETVID